MNHSTLEIDNNARRRQLGTPALDSFSWERTPEVPQVDCKKLTAHQQLQRLDMLLHQLPSGFVIINSERKILHANDNALRLLRLPEFRCGGVIHLSDRLLHQKVLSYIELANKQPDLQSQKPLHICIRRWGGKGALFLRIVSISYHGDETRLKERAGHLSSVEFVVSIVDQEQFEDLDLSQASVYYGLTQAEVAVLSLVIQGMSNKDIAQKRSVFENTVKSQIKSLLAKTTSENRTMLALKVVRCIPPI